MPVAIWCDIVFQKSSSASREPKEPKEPREPKAKGPTGPGAKKEIRLLSRNSAVPADSPLAASLVNVKPISRASGAGVDGGATPAAEDGGPVKLSRKEREREKEKQREARRQAAGGMLVNLLFNGSHYLCGVRWTCRRRCWRCCW